jgi:hypothetical protein
MGAVPAQAAIVSRAHASILPSFPKKLPISLLVTAAVALLSLAYVLARELIAAPAAGSEPANRSAVRSRRRVAPPEEPRHRPPRLSMWPPRREKIRRCWSKPRPRPSRRKPRHCPPCGTGGDGIRHRFPRAPAPQHYTCAVRTGATRLRGMACPRPPFAHSRTDSNSACRVRSHG